MCLTDTSASKNQKGSFGLLYGFWLHFVFLTFRFAKKSEKAETRVGFFVLLTNINQNPMVFF